MQARARRPARRELLADRDSGGRPQRHRCRPTGSHCLAGLADAQALTLHRLLGYEPYRSRFHHDAQNPIAADVVVVDEASMVDLSLLHALLDALRPDATLILVGDADQLASVAAGSVFMDMVAAMEPERIGDLVRLRHGFRAGHALAATSTTSVREGDAGRFDIARIAAAQARMRRQIAVQSRTGADLVRELRRWTDGIASLESLRPRLADLPRTRTRRPSNVSPSYHRPWMPSGGANCSAHCAKERSAHKR